MDRLHPQQFPRSFVVETSRQVAIHDAAGEERYYVRLMSSQQEDGHRGFKVQVVYCYPSDSEEDNSLLLEIPDDGTVSDYMQASKDFDICVQRYSQLIEAETKDFRDIDIYKDHIGYEIVQPECCACCKWARKTGNAEQIAPNWQCREKLECHNPLNGRSFQHILPFPAFPNKNAHRYCNDNWQKLPWMPENPLDRKPMPGEQILDPVFPHVDAFGKCKNFEKIEAIVDECESSDENIKAEDIVEEDTASQENAQDATESTTTPATDATDSTSLQAV